MAPMIDSCIFAFDLNNSLRLWFSEAVRRHEISPEMADESIRKIDLHSRAERVDKIKEMCELVDETFKVTECRGFIDIYVKLMRDFTRWWNANVSFDEHYIIIKNWPNLGHLIKGMRFPPRNIIPLIVQVVKRPFQATRAVAIAARSNIYVFLAADAAQFAIDGSFAHLLGNLTVDVPKQAISAVVSLAVRNLVAGCFVVAGIPVGEIAVVIGVGFLLEQYLERVLDEKNFTSYYEQLLGLIPEYIRGNASRMFCIRTTVTNRTELNRALYSPIFVPVSR